MRIDQMIRNGNSRFSDFALPGAGKKYAPDLQLEPVHTELHLSVDIDNSSMLGFALITIKANVDGCKFLELDAVDFEHLQVVSEDDRDLKHQYDGKKLRLEFSKALKSEEKKIVRIDYTVQDPISGLKFSKPDEHRPDFPYYAITDNETERARYWFPCVDFLTVRSSMEYYLSAPENLTILANGALVSEDIREGVKTAHWKLDYPCPSYLACFGIGEFSEFQDKPLRDIPIAYYADKSYTPEQLQRTFHATRDMLIWMEKKLGMDFPYPKYFQLAGREVGGAMENISLVTWDDKFVLDETMAKEWQYIMDLINVHEMAHSYFGDAVVAYDFAHVWLKESWATYIESIWLEDSEGKDAMDWQMAEEARSYMGEVKNRYARPIITREYDHSWSMFDMHLYPGGAWRLHMLRKYVGDDNFWAGVQDYVKDYAGKTVKSLDFQRCIEKRSGQNLDNFFDTWFHSKGYPLLKVCFEYDKDKKRGKFTIDQKQVDKEKGIDLFEIDLEIAWQDGKGIDHSEFIHLSKATQIFQLSMDEPKHLSLDPNMNALFEAEFNPGDDKLIHLLENGRTVRELMQAVSELAKTGKRKNLNAIKKFMETETRWGLRIHAYRELATVGNEYALEHLAELLVKERDPMVVEEAARVCGGQRHPLLRTAILKKLKEKNLPYRGEMALLESLGKQQDKEDLELLSRYTQKQSWRNLAKAGAYAGLGASHHEDALETMLQGIDAPVDFFEEKMSRLTGLGKLLDWLPTHLRKQAAQAICDQTRDPSFFVQLTAARQLGSRKISEGVTYLRALLKRLPEQHHPGIIRQIQAISASGQGTDAKKLQKQLDELNEKLAGMEKRLQEIETEKK
ncbi:MAG: hypothetical protein K9M49_05205 [Candidatus Marinimicrobia bacterium]|nr:hypothetical protein [Candidatus Neomarinimicrobiota bacterium]MCF7904534.1 hypothetical protein [Candidatus Neomarinimicrobiota bacterium]